MENKTFFEKRLKRREIFSGGAVNFRADSIRLPDGKTATREFMDHPGAVAVLPVLASGEVILVRQYRYPVGEATLEIPAGKLHSKNDSPVKRARAELREETGYTAASLKPLTSFWPTPAFSNELLHIYIATGLKAGKTQPDDDEFIKVERMPFKTALRLARTGKIRDAKTIIALQAYALRRDKED
ncbi:MAG: hypothetical protein A2270_08785 [Elusimicrobia bacterium RIFOXYA12_FULL_51_18]|nr:MAG: hypothetical protein A2270_08785 [Elusimicrobia bacterium RIFOXYA12_FULL_51_18]OGS31492.1 MAG: hypothetical protein A2218_09525 [Elusimicrobia bacterium RIFOXYA2_FULL_53_38]